MAHDPGVDAYLAMLPVGQREALQRLRAQIGQLMPSAEEAITYAIPTFKPNGRPVVWYAAWKNHLSFYPLTDTFLATHADALKGYRTTKGSVHFTPQVPLPETLVEQLVRARLADLSSGAR